MPEESIIPEVKKEASAEETIQISKSEYEAIITRFEELDKQLEAKGKELADDDIDDLAKEGRQALKVGTSVQQQKNIDDMTNTEVVNYILEQVTQYGQTIQQSVETLRVQREVDKCMTKYTDFADYEKEILKIAVANPTLSIEGAYKLAKAEVGEKKPKIDEKGEEGKGERRSTSAKILNLKDFGAKTTNPPTSLGGVVSVKDAAIEAAKKLGLS